MIRDFLTADGVFRPFDVFTSADGSWRCLRCHLAPDLCSCKSPFGSRRRAFTAIVESKGYALGAADEGTKGYTPVPGRAYATWEEARAGAQP